ncbi:hypothetical protein GGR52DRAFT_562306 [Hypoxylon sp. FL1284]|nr:hypothetical protein GGR52DRAFT_562306 [Hypoxylon sp. FL1284]
MSSPRHQSARRDPSPEKISPGLITPEIKPIKLLDLDDTVTRRPHLTVTVRCQKLSWVAAFLKSQFPSDDGLIPSDERIPGDATIQFFADSEPLDGDDIPEALYELRYRVLTAGDDGSIRIIWGHHTPVLLRPQLDQIVSVVAAGRSVGILRETVLKILGAVNTPGMSPNCVMIKATGGLRPGPLQGNNWEVRKVKTWLCRYVTISVTRATDHLVLRGQYGPNQQYVWHWLPESPRNYRTWMEAKYWLKEKILTAVDQRGHGHNLGINIAPRDIQLTVRGEAVKNTDILRGGETVDFDLSRVVEDKFIEAESWILPLSETCSACNNDKHVYDMPRGRRISALCSHFSDICKKCVGRWVAISSAQGKRRVTCPECDVLLETLDVQAHAPPEVFERYCVLETRLFLSSEPDFVWCLNPKCGSGHFYPEGCEEAICQDCGHHICVRHQVPWHSGKTCDEYNRRTDEHEKDEKASENCIKQISKPCPRCKRNTNKHGGCQRVTCVCGHVWAFESSLFLESDSYRSRRTEHPQDANNSGVSHIRREGSPPPINIPPTGQPPPPRELLTPRPPKQRRWTFENQGPSDFSPPSK